MKKVTGKMQLKNMRRKRQPQGQENGKRGKNKKQTKEKIPLRQINERKNRQRGKKYEKQRNIKNEKIYH